MRTLLGIILLLPACGWPALPAGDGYVRADGQHLLIQPLAAGDTLSVPGGFLISIDIGSDGRTLCGIGGEKDIWAAVLPDAAYRKLGVSNLDTAITPQAAHGACFFGADYLHLGIAPADGSPVTAVPIQSDDFVWLGLDYYASSDLLAIVGKDAVAVLRDPVRQKLIRPVRLQGTVRGLKFVTLTCCARLSPDGKTLYAAMEGESDDNEITALGAFDTATGRFKRFYIPYFFNAPRNFPDAKLDDTQNAVTFETADYGGDLALSPDGKTLYASAFYRSTSHESMVAIDVETGAVTQLPIAGSNKFGVSGNGTFLVVRGSSKDIPPGVRLPLNTSVGNPLFQSLINVFALPGGQYVKTLPGDDFYMILHPGR
ncbi:hypothetical protein ACVBGC_31735 [Burkholderia stagnalis]